MTAMTWQIRFDRLFMKLNLRIGFRDGQTQSNPTQPNLILTGSVDYYGLIESIFSNPINNWIEFGQL